MRVASLFFAMVVSVIPLTGCSSPGVPEPVKVLENPTTGERVRFFREIPFKVPASYSEEKHLADWTESQGKAGYTKEISPSEDREALADLRSRNLAKAGK